MAQTSQPVAKQRSIGVRDATHNWIFVQSGRQLQLAIISVSKGAAHQIADLARSVTHFAGGLASYLGADGANNAARISSRAVYRKCSVFFKDSASAPWSSCNSRRIFSPML
jgi:hypothetical protein